MIRCRKDYLEGASPACSKGRTASGLDTAYSLKYNIIIYDNW